MDLKLRNVRIAFCQTLFTAGAFNDGDKPAHAAKFLLEKNDPQIKLIKKAIVDVAKEQWKDKSDAILKQLQAKDVICLHDGDLKPEWAGFEGCDYISARSGTRPGIYGRSREELREEDGVIYAGCYVNVKLSIYAQDNKFGKRVNATLLGVQFVTDGDAFAGAGKAKAEDFDDLSMDEADDLL